MQILVWKTSLFFCQDSYEWNTSIYKSIRQALLDPARGPSVPSVEPPAYGKTDMRAGISLPFIFPTTEIKWHIPFFESVSVCLLLNHDYTITQLWRIKQEKHGLDVFCKRLWCVRHQYQTGIATSVLSPFLLQLQHWIWWLIKDWYWKDSKLFRYCFCSEVNC